jgi:hypothetical protein
VTGGPYDPVHGTSKSSKAGTKAIQFTSYPGSDGCVPREHGQGCGGTQDGGRIWAVQPGRGETRCWPAKDLSERRCSASCLSGSEARSNRGHDALIAYLNGDDLPLKGIDPTLTLAPSDGAVRRRERPELLVLPGVLSP